MSPRKAVILVVFSFVLVGLAAVEAFACSCAGPRSGKNFQPCGVFWNSDVVFIGTAENVSVEKDGRMIVRFAVEKAVRGVEGQTVEVETAASSAACGYPFKQGEQYFAYLKRGKDGKLTEWLCGATVSLKNAAVDLEYLKAVENGDTGGRIYGNVFQTKRQSFRDRGEYLPVAGTKITLKSVPVKYADNRESPKYIKREFQTTSDAKGFYLFRDVPAGLYTVKAEFQNGLRELYIRAGLIEHYISIDEDQYRCGGYNFNSTKQAAIEGRIVGNNRQKPPQQYVSLIPIDENSKISIEYSLPGVWTSKENGRFLFAEVPPGKYLLAINPQNCPSRENQAFGKMFLPGVAVEAEAEIISVAENERKTVTDFKLLPPLKERIFSGVVVSAGQTPISGAKVLLLGGGEPNKCGGPYGETKTDEAGRFQIKGYENYPYKIRAFIEKPARLYSDLFDISDGGNFENLELTVSKSY